MGSPSTEAGRPEGPEGKGEQQHWEQIGHSFAIAAREVTVAQFRKFYQAVYDKVFENLNTVSLSNAMTAPSTR